VQTSVHKVQTSVHKVQTSVHKVQASVHKGREGEQYAARVLEEAGMSILASNFRSQQGEVDLIARDGDAIVFIEVKTWVSNGIADLEYGINYKKQRRIIETAKYFLAVHREYNEMAIRVDEVFIETAPGSASAMMASPQIRPAVRHLASAFVECV
jgi:putative endonuclease